MACIERRPRTNRGLPAGSFLRLAFIRLISVQSRKTSEARLRTRKFHFLFARARDAAWSLLLRDLHRTTMRRMWLVSYAALSRVSTRTRPVRVHTTPIPISDTRLSSGDYPPSNATTYREPFCILVV